MVRRKTFFIGRNLEDRYDVALGVNEHVEDGDIPSGIDFEIPKIDWQTIQDLIVPKIPQYSRDEIDFLFEVELGFRVRRALTRKLSSEIRHDEFTESAFQMKVARIEQLARKLIDEVNGLAEIGTSLLVRPKRKVGQTSAEAPSMFHAKVLGRVDDPTTECFIDYYSFRKVLDYYSRFSELNDDFQSGLSDGFYRAPDYSWYETFVRRVVIAFLPTNFPLTVTIPTDTNPDFSSPIIVILERLRDQINQLAHSEPRFTDMYEEWSYRQHARLVLKLRSEFEESELFWTLCMVRKIDADQSAF